MTKAKEFRADHKGHKEREAPLQILRPLGDMIE
jgi:hypothetical protein